MNKQDEFYALEMVQQQLEHRSMGKGYLFSLLRGQITKKVAADYAVKEMIKESNNTVFWIDLAQELKLLDKFISADVKYILIPYFGLVGVTIDRLEKEDKDTDEKMES